MPAPPRSSPRSGSPRVATTSSGYAATLGRFDGDVGREEAITHAGELAQAVTVPVSADLENGFADEPRRVAETDRAARSTSAWPAARSRTTSRAPTTRSTTPPRRGADRGRRGGAPAYLVLTARCENHLHGLADLADTIARLQAYQEAGADVLYAPGLDRHRRHPQPVRRGRPPGQRAALKAARRRRARRGRRRADLGRRHLRPGTPSPAWSRPPASCSPARPASSTAPRPAARSSTTRSGCSESRGCRRPGAGRRRCGC